MKVSGRNTYELETYSENELKGNDIEVAYDKVKLKLRRLEREMDWERIE
jgi:hypothetical protein